MPFSFTNVFVKSYLLRLRISILSLSASPVFSHLYLWGEITLSVVFVIVLIVCTNQDYIDAGQVIRCILVFCLLIIDDDFCIALSFVLSGTFSFNTLLSSESSSLKISVVGFRGVRFWF